MNVFWNALAFALCNVFGLVVFSVPTGSSGSSDTRVGSVASVSALGAVSCVVEFHSKQVMLVVFCIDRFLSLRLESRAEREKCCTAGNLRSKKAPFFFFFFERLESGSRIFFDRSLSVTTPQVSSAQQLVTRNCKLSQSSTVVCTGLVDFCVLVTFERPLLDLHVRFFTNGVNQHACVVLN